MEFGRAKERIFCIPTAHSRPVANQFVARSILDVGLGRDDRGILHNSAKIADDQQEKKHAYHEHDGCESPTHPCKFKFRVKLTPDVDIEDLMLVFDYCGLRLVHPTVDSIDWSAIDTATRLSSKLYLKNLDLLDWAKEAIVAYLDDYPRPLTPFVFLMDHHDIQQIIRLNGGVIFAEIQDRELFEFVKEVSNPEKFVTMLQDEFGL